jgi:hypothetical protein
MDRLTHISLIAKLAVLVEIGGVGSSHQEWLQNLRLLKLL